MVGPDKLDVLIVATPEEQNLTVSGTTTESTATFLKEKNFVARRSSVNDE